MTDALPFRGSSGDVPLFELVESARLSALSIGCAGILTVLMSLFTVFALDYESKHPIAISIVRPKIEDTPTGIEPRPEVLFSCSAVHGGRIRLLAEVKQLPGHPAPSGQVRFLIGYETLKIAKIENGSAMVTVKLTKSQTQLTLRALYLGDDSYSSNYSNVSQPASIH